MVQLKYQFTLNDMPMVAEYIYRNFQRDHDEFQHYSSDFNQEFDEVLEERLNAIKVLPDIDKLDMLVEEKRKKLEIMTSHLRPLLNITEMYLKVAKNDEVESDEDMVDLQSLREGFSEKRVWEIQYGISRLLKYVNRNLSGLSKHGFPSRIIDDFKTLSDNLRHMEMDLAEAIHEKEVMNSQNVRTMNDLWEVLEDIWEASPEVFAREHPEKIKDYSPDEIIRHIHPSDQVLH